MSARASASSGSYPLRVERWETIPDTGGAGLNRGGNAEVVSGQMAPGYLAAIRSPGPG